MEIFAAEAVPLVNGISDVVWQSLIAAVVTVVIAWMQRGTQIAVKAAADKGEQTAETAATKVAEVKQTLKEAHHELAISNEINTSKLEDIKRTTSDTHTLVNGNYSDQLQLNAILARKLSNITSDAGDLRTAEEAEKRFCDRENESKQV